MKITSGWSLLAATAAGLVLFLVYAFVVATTLELAVDYLGRGCAVSGSGALREGGTGSAFCVEFWLNRYQTLIGGILALGGAYLAFSAVRQQISQVERHENERRERESNAARAVVTHALSKLNTYAGECVSVLRKHRPNAGHVFVSGPINPPKFPHDVIPILQNAVRYSSSEFAVQFADLIAQAQIQNSRMSYISEKSSASPHGGATFTDLQGNIFDALDLYVRSGRLFDYGRIFLDYHIVETSKLREAFRLLDLDHDDWPLIKLRLDAREQAEKSRLKV